MSHLRTELYAALDQPGTITKSRLRDILNRTMRADMASIEQAKADGWDAAVSAMVYADGSPVEVAHNSNPYREAE